MPPTEWRRARAALLTAGLLGLAAPPQAAAGAPDAGARLYLEGLLPDGTPLRGQREQGGALEGAEAACATCHRRSGLGTFEGAVRVPPVAWRLLARSAGEIAADRTLPHVLGFHPQRGAYSPATLARALREGIGADGQPLSWVMPRYPELDDAAIELLQGHLKTLAATPPVGHTSGELKFALVLTPPATLQDAGPGADDGQQARRAAAVQAVLERGFADHNRDLGQVRGAQAGSGSGAYDVARNLHLTVWTLQGDAQRWPAQLDRLQHADAPFALLGGLGGGDWGVIDQWCERHQVPLVLPGAEAPGADEGFYALHFQRGVRLEAALVAGDLKARHAQPVPVLQLWRAGDTGALAAQALRVALGPGWPVRDVVLGAAAAAAPGPVAAASGAAGPAAASADTGAGSPAPVAPVIVAWLRPADFGALEGVVHGERLYLSGTLAGEPTRVPAGWGEGVRIAYPWELPQRRRVAMNFPLGWFHAKGQPVVDLRAQTDAWLAGQVLEAALADMIDAYYPDYLVERVESLVGHRLANAHYPRLSLAPGQRFASKGGYLVRPGQDGALIPEGGWRIP